MNCIKINKTQEALVAAQAVVKEKYTQNDTLAAWIGWTMFLSLFSGIAYLLFKPSYSERRYSCR